MLGEGTTNIGYFHESINLAAVWKLPVVFLVENNQYGMGTEVGRASAVSEIFQKGCAYDIANRQINGQDVLEMYESMDEALELAREGGPVLLEALTYRYFRPLDGRPRALSQQGGDRGMADARPDPRLADKLMAEGQGQSRPTWTQIHRTVEGELAEIVQVCRGEPGARGRGAVRARLRQPDPADR